jgi:serpin B
MRLAHEEMARMRVLRSALLCSVAALCACDPPAPAPDKPPSAPAQSSSPAPKPSVAQSGKPSPDAPAPAIQPGGPAAPAVNASNELGGDLYGRLAATPGNLAFSPASISVALSMTYGGAKGDTAAEMAKVMHLPAKADELHGGWATALGAWQKKTDAYELASANRLFAEKTFKLEAPFTTLTKDRYGAPVEGLDFRSAHEAQRKHMNDWVKTQTRERIVDLIPERGVSADTRLVLVNALYFKAQWKEPFDADSTAEGEFFANGDKAVKVPMMNHTTNRRYAEIDGAKVVELTYKDGDMTMLFVLPEKTDGLPELEKKLSAAEVSGWAGKLAYERVWVTLPRFKIDPPESINLVETLEGMGMKLAFDAEKADFTGIANPPSPADRLYIGAVFHKAFLAVDESGTEAAAATAVSMPRAGGMPKEPKRFLADHPFLFLIRDAESGAILFMGRVVDPSATK